jgi:hypothetical protein
MSGSGGGGGGGGGDGGGPSPCETLRFDAQLVSTQAGVVATLTPGDVLDIALAVLKGQTIVQVLKSGQVAGGLTGPDANRLRGCIEDGHDFHATVLTVNGGQVRVRVEHA